MEKKEWNHFFQKDPPFGEKLHFLLADGNFCIGWITGSRETCDWMFHSEFGIPYKALNIHTPLMKRVIAWRQIMEKESHVASENMKVFFERLLELKNFVKDRCDKSDDLCKDHLIMILEKTYYKLDAMIKEKK